MTHAAYSPRTGLFYAPVQDVGATATRRRREFKESIPYWGAGVAVDTEDVAGYLSAIDPATGQEKWRLRNEHPMTASVLATAGDLVFAGQIGLRSALRDVIEDVEANAAAEVASS